MADNITNLNLSITVDDGYQRVPINNKYGDEIGVFYFNPTDIGIIERYNKLANSFDGITEPLESLSVDGDEDITDEKYASAISESKERLVTAVDELFQGNAAEAFFGKVNPFSPVDGMFYCETVLRVVGEFISKQFNTETEKFSARVAKYTNRASRRAKK